MDYAWHLRKTEFRIILMPRDEQTVISNRDAVICSDVMISRPDSMKIIWVVVICYSLSVDQWYSIICLKEHDKIK